MAQVVVNNVRRVTHAFAQDEAYLFGTKKIDSDLVLSVVAETHLDGSDLALDNADVVQRAILAGGKYFLTDPAGKAALGF